MPFRNMELKTFVMIKYITSRRDNRLRRLKWKIEMLLNVYNAIE